MVIYKLNITRDSISKDKVLPTKDLSPFVNVFVCEPSMIKVIFQTIQFFDIMCNIILRIFTTITNYKINNKCSNKMFTSECWTGSVHITGNAVSKVWMSAVRKLSISISAKLASRLRARSS